MRIAVVETAPFGGLLHYAVQLADALAAAGDEVDLIVPVHNELEARDGPARRLALLPAGPSQAEATTRLGILTRRARTATWRVTVWVRMLRAVRAGGYDAVVLNGSIDLWLTAVGAMALVWLSGRTEITHVCHNVRPFNRWGGDSLFASSRLLTFLLRRLYPAFELVFVHGERSRQEFEEIWPGARLAVVPHGDENIFTESPPPPAQEPRALFFGDWRRVKGLSVLMEAFDEVAAGLPAARLTIAGSPAHEEGEAETVMRWASERAGRVETVAHYVPLEEVSSLFGRARVVVLPYLVGYQSGVLHLAMTMGRAVIASDVGDLGAAVSPGETGLLVPPGEVAPLAAALGELLADAPRAEAMGAAARARAEGPSSWSSVALEVEAALRGVLGPVTERPEKRDPPSATGL